MLDKCKEKGNGGVQESKKLPIFIQLKSRQSGNPVTKSDLDP